MKLSLLFATVALACGGLGCSTTVRSMTATAWIAPPGAGEATPAETAPPVATGNVETTAAAAPAAAPAQGQAKGLKSQYYLTYWEGACKSFLGCGRGETHVKRCTVQADNSVTCVEEPDATKALAAD